MCCLSKILPLITFWNVAAVCSFIRISPYVYYFLLCMVAETFASMCPQYCQGRLPGCGMHTDSNHSHTQTFPVITCLTNKHLIVQYPYIDNT